MTTRFSKTLGVVSGTQEIQQMCGRFCSFVFLRFQFRSLQSCEGSLRPPKQPGRCQLLGDPQLIRRPRVLALRPDCLQAPQPPGLSRSRDRGARGGCPGRGSVSCAPAECTGRRRARRSASTSIAMAPALDEVGLGLSSSCWLNPPGGWGGEGLPPEVLQVRALIQG